MGRNRVRKYPQDWRRSQFREKTYRYQAILTLWHEVRQRYGHDIAMNIIRHYIRENWMDIPTHYVETPEPGDLEYVFRD